MNTKVMVCGVDCNPRDHNCTGYCEGKAPNPPDATEAQKRLAARKTATEALTAAERAWYEYAGLCEVGEHRTRAFAVYENVRNAQRRHSQHDPRGQEEKSLGLG